MNHRETVQAVLLGEKLSTVPILYETFMDKTVSDLLPLRHTGDTVRDAIEHAEFFGNSAINVGVGLKKRTIERDKEHHRYQYETGAVWEEGYQPQFFREALSHPINSPEDVKSFIMPDPFDPSRTDDDMLTRMVSAYHDAGYYVRGGVIGAWQGIYYVLTSFDNILTWMATEPEPAHALFDMMSRFNIGCARRLLAAGVDCIATASDLGTGTSLLFSPTMFREYVFPWLKNLADVCHEHGASLHLHSHGHIEDLMDGIVESGVDILNPVGPSDNNDLAMFKQRWGSDIVIDGGISTTIARMDIESMRAHVAEVVDTGRKGGKFFPCTESGVPFMSLDKIQIYLDELRHQTAPNRCLIFDPASSINS